jgi:hypothetical protein
MIKLLLAMILVVLVASCARQNYQTTYNGAKTKELQSSRVTVTGEVIGWDDIKRMPR